ncbi:ArsR/SmtB family transcription factor [Paramicrobacterium fandaimingii]|uniref:ArsR/SmtB family transcription factor n=1 Tax=Paramicrobacterium fandaimingii TaxID=2708079 RepID=UPI0014212635|nr:winged helix-turn-helix domain-containing protein [Microbacterium fandaimingii]
MASRLARPLLAPTEDEIDLFAVISALSDPVRRAIVSHIASHPGGACSSSDFGVSKSALTRHWRILRESGLISQEVDGTRHRNWLRTDALARRFPGLLPLVLDAIDAETTPQERENPPHGGSKDMQ